MSETIREESTHEPKTLSKAIKIDEAKIHSHLDKMVRISVEQTLNELLDAEAGQLCNAKLYERTEARMDRRAGHYKRRPDTRAGPVESRMPKLRKATFETAIIERYRRRVIRGRTVGINPVHCDG